MAGINLALINPDLLSKARRASHPPSRLQENKALGIDQKHVTDVIKRENGRDRVEKKLRHK